MIDMDDPAHLLRRKLVNAGFTRKRVMDKVPSIGALCDTLIDAVCERGECDFVRDIAAPLPMAVIGDMLGVLPEEREMFLKWSDDLVTGLSSHIAEADIQATMDAFAGVHRITPWSMIAKRRAEPDRRPVQRPGERRGRGPADVGRRDRHGDPADPDRRRRDHPPHAVRWHRTAAAPPRSVGSAGQPTPDLLPSAIEEMLRWTVAGEEHVPHADRGHRVPRHRSCTRARRSC